MSFQGDTIVWHAIIVDKSLKDPKVIDGLKVLGVQDAPEAGWKLYKVEVADDNLKDTIAMVQQKLSAGGWYVHFYSEDGTKIVVVFRHRVFELVNNPSFWKPAIEYGKSVGIPEEQLTFSPNKFEEEGF